jgi:hypothetical protein
LKNPNVISLHKQRDYAIKDVKYITCTEDQE